MRIGMCAIASPLEIPYLREWYDHHHQMGVTDFILFLNDWTAFDMVTFNRLFWREMNEGIVKAHRLDGPVKQLPAYNAGLIMAEQQNLDWAAFIDIDEFLTIRSDRTLEDILSEFSDVPQVAVNWRLFGSSGIDCVIDGDFSVLKRFRRCERNLNRHVKQIVNVSWFKARSANVPIFTLPHNTTSAARGLLGEMVMGPFNDFRLDLPRELEIDHFITKSREECRQRRSYRRSDTGRPREEGWERFFNAHDKNDIDEAELHWSKQA